MFRVVGNDERAGPQPRLDLREDLGIRRLRAVEQQQVDTIRQIDGQRAQRIAFTDLHEIVEPGRGRVRLRPCNLRRIELTRDHPPVAVVAQRGREAQAVRAEGNRIFSAFLRETLPDVSDATYAIACERVMTTLTTGGKAFSETARPPAEIDAYATAMPDMFRAYLAHLTHPAPD